MIIEIRKFGLTLTSRDDGKGAYAAIQPLLRDLKSHESIELDFTEVNTFSPSWADEFITNLYREYKDRLFLKHTDNPSVIATVAMLEKVNGVIFNKKDN
jgi:hypothetical protein